MERLPLPLLHQKNAPFSPRLKPGASWRCLVSKKKDLPALAHMRFTALHEGPSVQIMHIGSYAQEGPTVAKLHAFVEANNWKLRAKHHEIYLKDATRTAPEKLQTIIRQLFT